MLTVVDAVTTARTCSCDCFATLDPEEREKGIRAVYTLDDALRGWGYTPIYDVHGDLLWKVAQKKNDSTYRGVAVRFGECIYRRLLGSLLHECIHAVCGDTTKANYGVLFGLPYAVPAEIPERDEEAFLDDFNFGEARAVRRSQSSPNMARPTIHTPSHARDIGTYCLPGGNALVPALPGFRAVAHIDRQHHPERYYARGRKLEARARAWFDEPANLAHVVARIEEAAAVGLKKRPRRYPDPEVIARTPPRKIGRNEPCVCGSAHKFKDCCETRGELADSAMSLSR